MRLRVGWRREGGGLERGSGLRIGRRSGVGCFFGCGNGNEWRSWGCGCYRRPSLLIWGMKCCEDPLVDAGCCKGSLFEISDSPPGASRVD